MLKFINKHVFIWPLLGTLLLWILVGIYSGSMTITQLLSCSKLATFALLLALAQMIVVTSGNGAIDLSQIYILTLGAYVSCNVMGYSILLSIIVAILVGAACGFVNGCINVFLKVPAMVTTLASGYIIFTIILVIAPNMTTLPAAKMVAFINYNFLGISMLTFISIFISLIIAVILYKTNYGNNLHAVGQNRVASYYSGIPVNRTVITAFVIGGILCGISGFLCSIFIGGAFQDMGSTYFLPSIAAAFVGGTLASGGRSNVIGVFFGALMMSFLTTFLNTTNLPPGYQRLIQGLFLIFLLVASVSNTKVKKKKA